MRKIVAISSSDLTCLIAASKDVHVTEIYR
jgi:hypothetical protein